MSLVAEVKLGNGPLTGHHLLMGVNSPESTGKLSVKSHECFCGHPGILLQSLAHFHCSF